MILSTAPHFRSWCVNKIVLSLRQRKYVMVSLGDDTEPRFIMISLVIYQQFVRAQLCREETIGLKVFRKHSEDCNFRNFYENSEKYPFYSKRYKVTKVLYCIKIGRVVSINKKYSIQGTIIQKSIQMAHVPSIRYPTPLAELVFLFYQNQQIKKIMKKINMIPRIYFRSKQQFGICTMEWFQQYQ